MTSGGDETTAAQRDLDALLRRRQRLAAALATLDERVVVARRRVDPTARHPGKKTRAPLRLFAVTRDTTIDELGDHGWLDVRIANGCDTLGVKTLGALAALTEQQAVRPYGMGPRAIRVLRAILADAGLAFAAATSDKKRFPRDDARTRQEDATQQSLVAATVARLAARLAANRNTRRITRDARVVDLRDALLVTPRVCNACLRIGVETVGDLAARRESHIRGVRGCGRRSLAEMHALLVVAGLRFAPEVATQW